MNFTVKFVINLLYLQYLFHFILNLIKLLPES